MGFVILVGSTYHPHLLILMQFNQLDREEQLTQLKALSRVPAFSYLLECLEQESLQSDRQVVTMVPANLFEQNYQEQLKGQSNGKRRMAALVKEEIAKLETTNEEVPIIEPEL